MAIKIGIIGLGYWGPNLVRNFWNAPETQVVICSDVRKERCRRIALAYPGVECTDQVEVLVHHPEVEAIAVATPTSTHYVLVKQALMAGKHVLVTKPLTSEVAQAQELVDLAEQKGLILQVDHTFIYHPAVEKLKDIIVRGELGDPYYFDSVRINLGLLQSDISVIWDLAPHDISIMQYLIDRPVKWVQAVGARHAGQQVESMAYITVQFADNILGHCHVNWLAPVKIRSLMIGGSRRMAVYDDNLVTEKVKIYEKGVTINGIEGIYDTMVQYRNGDMYAPAIDNSEALSREIKHFAYCIQRGVKPITDGRAGLSVVRILAAAQESVNRDGQRIFLTTTVAATELNKSDFTDSRSHIEGGMV